MIGGVVALVVELTLLPVKARTRLVESLAAALRQINEMEGCVAFGIEEGVNFDVYVPAVMQRFEDASTKAKSALIAAETFCENPKNTDVYRVDSLLMLRSTVLQQRAAAQRFFRGPCLDLWRSKLCVD